jgi:hypothetical protein
MSRRPDIVSIGNDWPEAAPEHWGTREHALVQAMGKPLNESLPPAQPERTLPQGFSIFPDRQRPPETKGQRAVREIRSAKAKHAMSFDK